MPLRIRRGTNADRTTITPVQGEPIYTTDTKQLYIGDGTTAGGVQVGGGGTLTVNTQDFTASGTWTKPANALWVEVTMCGAGTNGIAGSTTGFGGGGIAGRTAQKTFLASALGATVSVTCGAPDDIYSPSSGSRSSFGTHLYAAGGANDVDAYGGSTPEFVSIQENSGATANYPMYGVGGVQAGQDGCQGAAMQPGGGGAGATTGTGGAGGKAATNDVDASNKIARGGGGAGGASGTTGVAGTAGGYDTITGFGHGGGGGGEGTAGAGGAGGAAVRGGGGGGGGQGTTAGGAGGAGGAGFVRVRTLCFG